MPPAGPAQGGDWGEAAELVRALFAVSASPIEAKAVLAKMCTPPRATARVAKFPRFGVLPRGAFDLRPGPDGRVLLTLIAQATGRRLRDALGRAGPTC